MNLASVTRELSKFLSQHVVNVLHIPAAEELCIPLNRTRVMLHDFDAQWCKYVSQSSMVRYMQLTSLEPPPLGQIKAFALAMTDSASLTSLSLSGNHMRGSGEALGRALQSKLSKLSLKELGMMRCGLHSEDGKNLAGGLAVHASLTAANVLNNNFDTDTISMLLKVKEEHPKLTTLCGFKGDEACIDLHKDLGPADPMLIAPEISASWTECNIGDNRLQNEGVAVICKAVEEMKETELATLHFHNNCIDGAGAWPVAAMLATSSLTGALPALCPPQVAALPASCVCTGEPPSQLFRRSGVVRHLRHPARQPAEQDLQVGPL